MLYFAIWAQQFHQIKKTTKKPLINNEFVKTTVRFLSTNPHIHWVRQNVANSVALILLFSVTLTCGGQGRDFPLAVKDAWKNKGLLCNTLCVYEHIKGWITAVIPIIILNLGLEKHLSHQNTTYWGSVWNKIAFCPSRLHCRVNSDGLVNGRFFHFPRVGMLQYN